MCTLVILRRPGHDWPVLIAANRDEMIDRSWLPPGRHWPDRAQVTAGQDELAGGTWLGVNDDGLAAGILNRTGALGPAAGKRSRGELVLDALDHADAAASACALADIDGEAYRPFNLVVADSDEAFWLRHDASKAPVFHPAARGSFHVHGARAQRRELGANPHASCGIRIGTPAGSRAGCLGGMGRAARARDKRLGGRSGGGNVHRADGRVRHGQRVAHRATAPRPAWRHPGLAFRARAAESSSI